MWYLSVLPIINVAFSLLLGVGNNLAKQLQGTPIISFLGDWLSSIIDSNGVGGIWLLIFILTFILCVYSFIHAFFGIYKDKNYIKLGSICILSIIISLIIVAKLFPTA